MLTAFEMDVLVAAVAPRVSWLEDLGMLGGGRRSGCTRLTKIGLWRAVVSAVAVVAVDVVLVWSGVGSEAATVSRQVPVVVVRVMGFRSGRDGVRLRVRLTSAIKSQGAKGRVSGWRGDLLWAKGD